MDVNGTIWLLDRIDWTINGRKWRATHRNIWQGCYDVWEIEQDMIDSGNIPRQRMQAAEDDGLITSVTVDYGKYKQVEWKLTERGEELLKGGK